MAIQMGKTLALVAVGGMVAGLAACGGSQPTPETQATPGTESQAHSCSGKKDGCSAKHGCSSNGQCGGKKDADPGASEPK